MNRTVIPRRLWVTAGGLALAHVVLMLVGIMLQSTPTLTEGEAGIQDFYVDGDLVEIMTGGYIELVAFMLLIPAIVFLGRAIGRRTEAARWVTQTAAAAGIAYVALTVGSGLAPGAAALWGTQHGLALETALVVNNVRNFAYFLGLALLGAHAVGLGVAAAADGFSRRWVGWGGIATGAVLLVAVPGASVGLQDYASLVWLVWWIGVAVTLLLHRPSTAEIAPEHLAVRHA